MARQGLGTEVVYPVYRYHTSSSQIELCQKANGFNEKQIEAPDGLSDYKWSTGSESNAIIVSDTGSVWVIYKKGCNAYVDTFNLVPYILNVFITVDKDTLSTLDNYKTYQWYLNGAKIQGANERKLIVKENGDYAVEVTDENDCMGTSDIYKVNNTTNIRKIHNKENIIIYPNPAQSIVNVKGISDLFDISVLNMHGRLMAAVKNNSAIDVSNIPEGIYIIKVTDKNGCLLTQNKLAIFKR